MTDSLDDPFLVPFSLRKDPFSSPKEYTSERVRWAVEKVIQSSIRCCKELEKHCESDEG